MELAITIVQLIVGVLLVLVVLFQTGKSSGISSVMGVSNSGNYMSKNGNSSLDKKLASATKWLGVALVVLTVVLNII